MSNNSSVRKISDVDKIGDTTEFFKYPMAGLTLIEIDLKSMKYINSIGVKNWILWVNKVPANCKVTLHHCPLMMISQASTVTGFLKPSFSVESFFAPFTCPDCEDETLVLLKRGEHYDYASPTKEKWVLLPKNIPCAKCKPPPNCEPDFFEDRIFKFLDQ